MQVDGVQQGPVIEQRVENELPLPDVQIEPLVNAVQQLPYARQPVIENNIEVNNLGPMTVECRKCKALHWRAERLVKSSDLTPKFGMCCLDGKIQLPNLQPQPELLRRLFHEQTAAAKGFREHIRRYNFALAFTSLGANFDRGLLRNGPYVLKLLGGLYHHHGTLLPDDADVDANGNQHAQYAQLYIFDPANAFQHRQNNNQNQLDPVILNDLQELMLAVNPLVGLYRQAAERLREAGNDTLRARLTYQVFQDPRRYNLPNPNLQELAVVLPGDGLIAANRDIILQLRRPADEAHQFQRISEGNALYAPLQYVLFFPLGELGWHYQIPYRNMANFPQGNPFNNAAGPRNNPQDRSHKWVSMVKYYAYRLMPRRDEPETILRGGKLLQQYIVDAWAASEQQRLRWMQLNQTRLRADLYNQVVDAFARDDVDAAEVGRKVILPATFTGSPRNMMESCQNSLAISRRFGNPMLFITMTANPKWPEIENALLEGQTIQDRPDLVVRVFELKKKALLKKLKEEGQVFILN